MIVRPCRNLISKPLVCYLKTKTKFTSDASAVGSKVEPRLRGIYVDIDDGANDNSEWIFLFVISA